MKLTIHRGTHEIGGNCIEIATQQSRIVLDVGLPLFNRDREPHDSAELRRQSSEELRQRGILPDVPGLFGDGPRVDAILLSHAHEDHTGLLRHSRPEIPIHASVGTSKMMLAGARFAGQPALPRERQRELRSGVPTEIGNLRVTPFSVDHSIYGSQSFLIEAEGKSVLYSGDLRMHGRKPGMHRSLIQAVGSQSINLLLMEGTHIGHPDHRGPTEYELEAEIEQHIQSAPGLVLASLSPQHVDRLVGFFKATERTGRIFVPDAYTAFVMHLVASEIDIPRPESSEQIRVFFPNFFVDSYRKKRLENFVQSMSPVRIMLGDIRSNSSRYVMIFRPSMLESDFGGTLPSKSRCLYSRWTGYLDRPDWQPVKGSLMEAAGDLIEVHTSGHIFADDITTFVNAIGAKSVVPIHTFEPERFSGSVRNVKLLADGETLEIDN